MAKRSLSFVLSILLTTCFLTPPVKATTVKIAIAYDVGGKGDNGVNDLASVGLERAIKKYNLSKKLFFKLACLQFFLVCTHHSVSKTALHF